MQVLITAGQLLAGPMGERTPDAAVLVDGAMIVAAGPRARVRAIAGPEATRIDRPNATVLPGLVDAHVHLAFEPGPGLIEAVRDAEDLDLVRTMAGHARQLLDAGVTTARDLGDRGGLSVRIRDAVAAGRLAGPRLRVATVPLTVPDGHCWFLGGEVAGEAGIRARVRANAAAGADWIKVMGSGGQLTPGGAQMWEPQFTAAELAIVVDEARRHGLPVAVHAHGTTSIADAVAAGVSTVEHCTFLAGPSRSDFRPDLADSMAAAGVVACPASSGNWRPLAKRVGRERIEELFGRLRRLADHGVTVILGSDAGLNPFAGFAGVVANWGDWGFSPGEMIETATTGAAVALGLGSVTGRIAPGMEADLLLVDGDPLADLTALRRISHVVARGRVHVPGSPPVPAVARPTATDPTGPAARSPG